VLSLLRAAAPQASTDDLLQWLKACPTQGSALARWEQRLRQQKSASALADSGEDAIEFIVDEPSVRRPWRSVLSELRRERAFSQWLHDVRQALQCSGQWALLQRDAAGQQVLAALHLEPSPASTLAAADDARMSLGEFGTWAQWALEGASFKPAPAQGAVQAVILPLAQLAARPFAAVVLAGADEVRLPAAPEPSGDWSAAQRLALGLPSREDLAQEQRRVWQQALQNPRVDVFWRAAEGDASLQASPLLQAWLLEHAAAPLGDARQIRSIQPRVQDRPAPSLPQALLPSAQRWSASSYADLRACPYRFFALRGLGLQEAQELDEGVSKREFGAWLHAVLDAFHRQRPRESDAESDRQCIEQCAADAMAAWQHDVSFLPFAASWPPIREAYLNWLAAHEALGWRFESSERVAQRELESGETLHGRLDRVDVMAGSGAQHYALIDYKTESAATLKARVAEPLEDTQLVFYAALLGREQVQAMYVALGEAQTQSLAQTQVNEALPLLLQGLQHDAQRIRQGHGLPALGEGKACDYCAARGLCRKDFWRQA
jgi:ATP-dependent helicase/nuclease subunit B